MTPHWGIRLAGWGLDGTHCCCLHKIETLSIIKKTTAMSSFVIEGGYKLSGTIRPQGAKNEALEVISATLLTEEEVTISNVPEILDVRNLIILLEGMGVKVNRIEKGKYTFKADDIDTEYISSDDFVRKCIGRRRVDTHITGMINLGASLDYDEHKKAFFLHVPDGRNLSGKYMLLDEASVTGTANILMAATLAEGTTTIYNAACEPYIQQLCRMLTAMGVVTDLDSSDSVIFSSRWKSVHIR